MLDITKPEEKGTDKILPYRMLRSFVTTVVFGMNLN